MKATQLLHNLGQSIWLDNITRDLLEVHEWLATAAQVNGFIGFAVGRTVFWDPLVGWLAKKTTRDAAVAEIARRYRKFVDTFEEARISLRKTA